MRSRKEVEVEGKDGEQAEKNWRGGRLRRKKKCKKRKEKK